MWIMNVVWPMTGLYGGLLTVAGYYAYGKATTRQHARAANEDGEGMSTMTHTPFPAVIGKAATHCGAGCTLGDICAEWLAFAFPALAVWFGWKSVFADRIFAVWVLDYVFAFGFGIAFQYFTIKPMRGLTPCQGIVAAVKADTLSLTAWQVGMYGFMAIAHFWIFGSLLGVRLDVDSIEFWFMMQIAMLFGFVTVLSGQLVAHPDRCEGEDVTVSGSGKNSMTTFSGEKAPCAWSAPKPSNVSS